MRQAIKTKYFGPTNYRKSRVKASCNAGTLTRDWDYRLSTEQNFNKIAGLLIEKLGWDKHIGYQGFVSGALTGDENCHILIYEEPNI